MKLSEHFELREFTRNSYGLANEPPAEVIPVLHEFCKQVLEPLRKHVGRAVLITSGYRSVELNRKVGGIPDSYHCATPTRCAADIQVPGIPLVEVFRWLCEESILPFDKIILERGKRLDTESEDCIHIQFRTDQPRRLAYLGPTHGQGRYTTSHATLDLTNYNVITWASVSGATDYRVWRTTTSTAPTGTGNFLVGTTASTTINDQSNTLNSATVPSCNDTDPEALSSVRVARPPSPSIQFAPAQVIGTAVVKSPTSEQTVTAPLGSGVPLAIKGRSGNTANVFEVYDNAGSPGLKFGVTSAGIPFIPTGTLSCGAGAAGRMLVDATTLQVCDSQGTPALKRLALGDSSGNALAGDSATGFFSSGNLELPRLPVGAANQILGTDSGASAQEHKTFAVGSSGTDFAIAHAPNLITFNLPDASATARGAVTTGTQTFAGNKTFNGAVAIGAGTAITKHLSASASLDFGSVAANTCSTLTITVTGAADGNVTALGVPNTLASTAGLVFDSFVSAADTVTVKACNVTTSASADPAAATVRADVWQH